MQSKLEPVKLCCLINPSEHCYYCHTALCYTCIEQGCDHFSPRWGSERRQIVYRCKRVDRDNAL